MNNYIFCSVFHCKKPEEFCFTKCHRLFTCPMTKIRDELDKFYEEFKRRWARLEKGNERGKNKV